MMLANHELIGRQSWVDHDGLISGGIHCNITEGDAARINLTLGKNNANAPLVSPEKVRKLIFKSSVVVVLASDGVFSENQAKQWPVF